MGTHKRECLHPSPGRSTDCPTPLECHPNQRHIEVLLMDLVINGRFLTQNVTGVQRYARELVQALDELLEGKSDVRVTVMSPRLSDTPPMWRNILLHQVGCLRGHAWEQLELPWFSRGQVAVLSRKHGTGDFASWYPDGHSHRARSFLQVFPERL